MSENLVRAGGGLAALIGGVLGVIASIMVLVFVLPLALNPPPSGIPFSVIITNSLLILAWVLVLGGLVGLYVSQQESVGTLGLVSFVLALVGTVLLVGVLCVQTFYLPVAGISSIRIVVSVVALVTMLVVTVGWFLFGLATFRARIYPRPAAILLMVGAAFALLIHFAAGEFIFLFAATAWLGFSLFRGKISSVGEPASPS